jgi:hypothetical protein
MSSSEETTYEEPKPTESEAEAEPEPEPEPEPESTSVDTSMSVSQTKTKKIVSFDIANIIVNPFRGAVICIAFSYESGESFNTCLEMTTDDYEIWGEDDNYVFQFVKDNLDSLV